LTRVQLAKRVAEIIVYGHLLLLLSGIYVYFHTPYVREETFQIVLMGSPVLALVTASAFKYLAGQVVDTNVPADPTWARLSIVLSILFIAYFFWTYYLASTDNPLSIEQIKYLVGGGETVLGAYLGIIRDKLFPEIPEPPPAPAQQVVLPQVAPPPVIANPGVAAALPVAPRTEDALNIIADQKT
jgi:uncharacterized membrane protein